MLGVFTRGKKLLVGGLDLLWGGLLFGGYLFGRPQPPRPNRIPLGVDLASSAALVGAAWALRSATPKGPTRRFATRIATGMTLGAIGDVFMKKNVPAGMGAFGVGHIAYIAAVLGLSDALGGTSALRRYGAWAGWIGLGVLGWYFTVYLGPRRGSKLAWAALGYCALLASTAGVATSLVMQRPRYVSLLIGGVLFVLSDLLIAMRIFNPEMFQRIPDAIRSDIVWLTYGPAQALIVHGILAAIFDPLLNAEPVPK
jgi:hypothetical protein